MMRTVKEVSTLTGVSVRTLHHYDAIGLLKPTAVSAAGYRLYDEMALRRLQSILLFRELQFPLKDIKAILDSPSFDPADALQQQIELLELQQQRLTALIAFARELQKGGIHPMTFHVFNNNELDRYKKEAKERWQHTKEYQDYAQCHNDDRANQTAAAQLMGIFAKLGSLREQSPTSPLVQEQIQTLQQCISEHFYVCDTTMLANLGQLYVSDERFTHNIDNAGGEGTAAFVKQAIDHYCDNA